MNAVKDYKEAIICPYCFETFSHKDVHFRMESYFDENNLNDEGYQEEDFAILPDGAEKDRLLAQTKERKPFLIRDDPRYTEWWKQYGETTERPYGIDKKLLYPVFQLPVLNPNDPKDQESLEILHPEREGVDKYLELDGDKMAISVKDRYGESTQRRVCPFCHNPLPAHYGKNRVRFISVIGITGSGKTVYLSQLLNQLPDAVSKLKLSAYATSNIDDFIANNPVMEGKPLPPASVEGRFSQPMVYDISKNLSLEQKQTNTIVLYDIAGEDCQSANAMQKYGKFVQHSDGIILLVDPSQINVRSEYTFTERSITIAPQLVLQTIHNVFLNLPSAEKCKTPMAVCVSKSDSFWDDLGDADGNTEVKEVVARDITPVLDEKSGQVLPNFNATEYNKIHNEIKKLTMPAPEFYEGEQDEALSGASEAPVSESRSEDGYVDQPEESPTVGDSEGGFEPEDEEELGQDMPAPEYVEGELGAAIEVAPNFDYGQDEPPGFPEPDDEDEAEDYGLNMAM